MNEIFKTVAQKNNVSEYEVEREIENALLMARTQSGEALFNEETDASEAVALLASIIAQQLC